MCRVIDKIISGFSVGEDGQPAPLEYGPCRKLPKALLGDGELTASARVRPDRMLVEPPDCHPEQGVRLASERLSGTELVGIKIDVGVEVSEIVHPAKIVRPVRRSRAETAPSRQQTAIIGSLGYGATFRWPTLLQSTLRVAYITAASATKSSTEPISSDHASKFKSTNSSA
jgi:hypothetical protein